MYPAPRMRAGLSTRIFLGFLVLLLVFAGASGLAVRRMHAIREDLVLVHRGYLALARGATQARTLHEARDATLARALATPDPALRRTLLGSAREAYGKALAERIDELDALTRELLAGRARPSDRTFLESLLAECAEARTHSDAYDEATGKLADAADTSADASLLAEEQRLAGELLSERLRSLSVAVDGKVSEAVLRAERDEREAAWAVVALSLVAAFIGVLVALVITIFQGGGAGALSPQQAVLMLNQQEALPVDLRPEAEYRAGHIINAVNVGLQDIAAGGTKLAKYKTRPLLLYCESGAQAGGAVKSLRKLGFAEVRHLKGGLSAWRGEQLPVMASK